MFTLALLLGSFSLAAQAIGPADNVTVLAPYVVERGDNLWNLGKFRMGNPLLWEKIYERNPFLQKDGRRFTKNGIVYVLIKPGEILEGLQELGITPTLASLDELGLPAPSPIVKTERVVSGWTWFLLGLALVVLAVSYLIYRMLNQDPATSRPPVIIGGVRDPELAREVFQRSAMDRFGRGAPDYVLNDFTILDQVSGRVWGVLSVRYANGRSFPRQLHGEPAYRARVRFPDRHEETLYMLQACGNDLRFGGISRYLPGPGFRFEPDVVQHQPATISAPAATVAPTTEPTPTTTPAAQASVPAPAPVPVGSDVPAAVPVATTPAADDSDGMVTLKFQRATPDKPQDFVQATGIDTSAEVSLRMGNGKIEFRFRPLAPTNGN